MPDFPVRRVVFTFPLFRSRVEVHPTPVLVPSTGLFPIARNPVVIRGACDAHGSIFVVTDERPDIGFEVVILREVQAKAVVRPTVELLGYVPLLIVTRGRAGSLISPWVEGQPFNQVAVLVVAECLPPLKPAVLIILFFRFSKCYANSTLFAK